MMHYPEFLKPGGTIAFAAPSFGASAEPFHSLMLHAIAYFQSMGYHTIPGPNTFLGKGTGISNYPESCAAELEHYYSEHGDVLISVTGGELMCETLGKLNLNKIASAHPKWFLGYSDNTNFGFLLPTMFDTASLYGPNAMDFGTEPLHPCFTDCMNLLTGTNLVTHGYDKWQLKPNYEAQSPMAGYHLTEPTRITCYNWDGSPIEGRFLGGCLDVLEILCGTQFDHVRLFHQKYGQDGIIWFLEACDLNAMNIRRSLWHLKNAGWFDCARAFVFGRPLHIADGPDFCGVDEYNAATAILSDFHVPILMDADFGHLPPSMTMINGGYGVLTKYKENNIQITWQLH